jgi:hypothetical protein
MRMSASTNSISLKRLRNALEFKIKAIASPRAIAPKTTMRGLLLRFLKPFNLSKCIKILHAATKENKNLHI